MPYRGCVGPSISLDLTVDDLIAYNVHVLDASKATKNQVRRLQLLLLPMILVMVVLVLYAAIRRSPMELVTFTTIGVAILGMVFFLPRYVASTIPRRVRSAIASGLASVPTPSRLWVDDHGGVIVELHDRTTWYSPAAIDRIDETPDHVFVIVGPGQALIIPRRVGEPVVQAFLQAMNWHRAQRANALYAPRS